MKTTVAKIVYSPCPPSSKDVIWGKTVNGKIEFQTFGNEGWKTIAKEDILKDIFQIKEEILEELEDYIEEVTSQADWNQNDSEAVDYIKNKPTIPSAQVQADWSQTTSTESDYIKNKPAIKAGQGVNSIIESKGTTASGDSSHAEGLSSTASGNYSHAEGQATHAEGQQSHAEGYQTAASSPSSHAEGSYTGATGSASHAEGYGTLASGINSHAEGSYTTANHKSQHVFGEYNIADPSPIQSTARGSYVEIVGNGAYANNSNARTLDWSGNEVLAGTITANGVNLNDALNLKQDALGFIPENVANKKTTLDDNSDTYYPTQKAVKTAVDAKVEGPNSSVANTLPVFADETGRLLKGDTGVSVVNSEIIAGGVNINSAIAGIPTQISNALTLLDGELAFIFRES